MKFHVNENWDNKIITFQEVETSRVETLLKSFQTVINQI